MAGELKNKIAQKRHQISIADFIILQVFYVFQSVYETFVSIFNWNFWKKKEIPKPPEKPKNEKRHFIQLYRTEPKIKGEKPVCYMNVIEFDSSCPEEEIRKRKRSYDFSNSGTMRFQRHCRTRSDNDLQRFFCSNLRY
ncbi:hypothetical protein ABEB36_005119 [Hypothenemus hampei]|uniref:Uncharacterized protein n=1 Tax=Hypothenemus hampei TaxID=57062 RepID=A0ABD1F0Y0_HYPHA